MSIFGKADSSSVGVGVLDDPSVKFDLDGQILPHADLPPGGGRDVEDAIPYMGKINGTKNGPRLQAGGQNTLWDYTPK